MYSEQIGSLRYPYGCFCRCQRGHGAGFGNWQVNLILLFHQFTITNPLSTHSPCCLDRRYDCAQYTGGLLFRNDVSDINICGLFWQLPLAERQMTQFSFTSQSNIFRFLNAKQLKQIEGSTCQTWLPASRAICKYVTWDQTKQSCFHCDWGFWHRPMSANVNW